MANQKVTDLTALGATPASDDVLYIVDTSDTSGGAAGTSKKVTYANIGSGGDDHFVVNGGGFLSTTTEVAITFGMSTTDSATFSYITLFQVPINCRVVSVRSMSQSAGGSTNVSIYKPSGINVSVASQTALGTVNIASHTAATSHVATFNTATFDFSAGDNLGVTFDSTTNLNGAFMTVLLKTI